jgi:hypothetical protein
VYAGGRLDLVADDLARSLPAQRTAVDGGPRAVGPPRLRDFSEAAASAVPFGDLGDLGVQRGRGLPGGGQWVDGVIYSLLSDDERAPLSR